MKKETKEELICANCNKQGTVSKRKIKENGVVGYYDIDVVWCDECVGKHNKYLLENWGGNY